MQTVEKPDTVTFVSKYSSLRYPVFEKDNPNHTVLQFEYGKKDLSESQDGEVVKELRRLIEDQYQHDKDGNKVVNEKGSYLLRKTELPFTEYNTFESGVVKTGQAITISDSKGGYVALSPEEILKMAEELKTLKDLFEGEQKFENLKSEKDEEN